MSIVIRNERPEKLAEEVKTAFTKAKYEALRDLAEFEEENKNSVNARIAESTEVESGQPEDLIASGQENQDQLDARIAEIKSITAELLRINGGIARKNAKVARMSAKIVDILDRVKKNR